MQIKLLIVSIITRGLTGASKNALAPALAAVNRNSTVDSWATTITGTNPEIPVNDCIVSDVTSGLNVTTSAVGISVENASLSEC